MRELVVQVTLEGGVIQGMKVPRGVRVVVHDYDVEGVENHANRDANGDPYLESEWLPDLGEPPLIHRSELDHPIAILEGLMADVENEEVGDGLFELLGGLRQTLKSIRQKGLQWPGS